ncbi:MAG: VCBS repeat-containing protein [Nannocystis sp.]|nr:VCBS repeat-containing protein [Nannocystis sp.]
MSVLVGLAACNGDDVGTSEATTTSDSTTDTTSTSTTSTSSESDTEVSTTSTSTSTSTSTTSESTSTTVDTTTDGVTTSTTTDGTTTDDTTTGGFQCGDVLCPDNYLCLYDACIPDLGPCASYDDCPGDSYCDNDGQCIPYGVPPDKINDENCQKPDFPAGVTPVVQCEWTGPNNVNDLTNLSHYIYTTPLVADLNLDDDPDKLQPSVIVTTWRTITGGRLGMLRVFDGRTCEEQMRIGGEDEMGTANRLAYGAQIAVADLDGDVANGGHPEIIALHRDESVNPPTTRLIAFGIDNTDLDNPKLNRLWYGRDCGNNNLPVNFGSQWVNHGPSVIDLNDDGIPEIVHDEMVFAANGCIQNAPSYLHYLDLGVQSAVVDVDLDSLPDLVRFNRIAGWNNNTKMWETKPWFFQNANQKSGHVAIANAGTYSSVVGKDINELPEIVVVSAPDNNAPASTTGEVRMMALNGSTVWGPTPIYKGNQVYGGRGGPPTVSDFDGDGQVEFAVAGAYFYTVYDPDCANVVPAQRPGGKCERAPDMLNMPNGVLWAQPASDWSSNITGSSIFDFDGDGKPEVVYRDECWARVYDGSSGKVIFSAPGFSLTGMENPVVADVDGDFASEIVVPRTLGNITCPAVDPLFAESGTHVKKSGFVVYRDPEDRWANSRPVWNQHSYSITHITDQATVPKSTEIAQNWLVEGLNNYRQNTQGGFGNLDIADLTVEMLDLGSLCMFGDGEKVLTAEVCNRGTAPVQDGAIVAFYETANKQDGFDQAKLACSTSTQKLLNVGDCEVVDCLAVLKGDGNIFVKVDPDSLISDCHPGNNLGADAFEICPG